MVGKKDDNKKSGKTRAIFGPASDRDREKTMGNEERKDNHRDAQKYGFGKNNRR